LELEKRGSQGSLTLPEPLQILSTPLCYTAWEHALQEHPDQQLVQYILRGISGGFRIGFNKQSVDLESSKSNMLSAEEHPQVVSSYIETEVGANRMLLIGTREEAQKLAIHCSPFGVIPKKNKPGKWRLILDLSAPTDHSVNDGIAKELCSLSYTSVDDVVSGILSLGQGSVLAKLDIKHAYRNIPVHPHDRRYLGMIWNDKVFIDAVLPFGLRSAPLIFSAVADALLWIMQRRGATMSFHYLDDFITIGSPNSTECERNIEIMKSTCKETGLPVEEEKCEGPATCLTFLGIEIDTVALELRLPSDKLYKLRCQLKEWRGRKVCTKRELLSLIGTLSHACKVVRAGRTFLRRLIDRSTVVQGLNHIIRLHIPARADIEWWYHFSVAWNGTSMLADIHKKFPSVVVTSDASGTWGCGAWSERQWFQLKWDTKTRLAHITWKELLPIVIASAIWGHRWQGQTVLFRCDNSAVVAIINHGSSHDQEVMHLMRCLSFIVAKFQLLIVASHIPGKDNHAADALSRDRLTDFRSFITQAQEQPSSIPVELLDLLVITKPDWTSPAWTRLWTSIF